MIAGSAAIVSPRAPLGPSCMTTMDPLWALWITFETIALTPGLAQSRGSTSQLMVTRCSAWARLSRAELTLPSGGRKSQGRKPVARRISRLVSCNEADEGVDFVVQ